MRFLTRHTSGTQANTQHHPHTSLFYFPEKAHRIKRKFSQAEASSARNGGRARVWLVCKCGAGSRAPAGSNGPVPYPLWDPALFQILKQGLGNILCRCGMAWVPLPVLGFDFDVFFDVVLMIFDVDGFSGVRWVAEEVVLGDWLDLFVWKVFGMSCEALKIFSIWILYLW